MPSSSASTPSVARRTISGSTSKSIGRRVCRFSPAARMATGRGIARRGEGDLHILGGLGADEEAALRAQQARKALVHARNAVGQVGVSGDEAAGKERGRDLARAPRPPAARPPARVCRAPRPRHGRVRAQKARLRGPGVQRRTQKRVLLHGAGEGRAGDERAHAPLRAPPRRRGVEPPKQRAGVFAVAQRAVAEGEADLHAPRSRGRRAPWPRRQRRGALLPPRARPAPPIAQTPLPRPPPPCARCACPDLCRCPSA